MYLNNNNRKSIKLEERELFKKYYHLKAKGNKLIQNNELVLKNENKITNYKHNIRSKLHSFLDLLLRYCFLFSLLNVVHLI